MRGYSLPAHSGCGVCPAARPFRGRAWPTYHEVFSTCGLPFRLTFFFLNFQFQGFNVQVCQLVKHCFFFHNIVYKIICSNNSVLPNFISERLNRWICASLIPIPLSATHTTNFPFTYSTFKMTNPFDVHL